nr:hypothetical protein [Salmonella sp.]
MKGLKNGKQIVFIDEKKPRKRCAVLSLTVLQMPEQEDWHYQCDDS